MDVVLLFQVVDAVLEHDHEDRLAAFGLHVVLKKVASFADKVFMSVVSSGNCRYPGSPDSSQSLAVPDSDNPEKNQKKQQQMTTKIQNKTFLNQGQSLLFVVRHLLFSPQQVVCFLCLPSSGHF